MPRTITAAIALLHYEGRVYVDLGDLIGALYKAGHSEMAGYLEETRDREFGG
jgi:hypothetical protein